VLIFLDTEFTDFIDCDLISIGMVSEDGQHVFYAERNDFRHEWENDFVRVAVLPYLGQFPEAVCTREELTQRLRAWFASLPRSVQIACDAQQDLDLLRDALDEELPANIKPGRFNLASLIDTTVFHKAVCHYHEQPGQPWHHALYDAHAHRHGWMAWMDAHKEKKQA
jgi:hypothetical protein